MIFRAFLLEKSKVIKKVSAEGQVKQGYSIAEQQAEIEKYCVSQSYKLINVFRNEGISGAKANEDETG